MGGLLNMGDPQDHGFQYEVMVDDLDDLGVPPWLRNMTSWMVWPLVNYEKSPYLPGFIKHGWKIPYEIYEMEVFSVENTTDLTGRLHAMASDDTTATAGLGPFCGGRAEAMTFTLVGFCTLSHAMYTVQLPLGAGG